MEADRKHRAELVAEEAARRKREAEEAAAAVLRKQLEEEARRRKEEADALERIAALRRKEEEALTVQVHEEFGFLHQHYPRTIDYERLSKLAKLALLSRDTNLATYYHDRRAALQYTPPDGTTVQSLRSRWIQLKYKILARTKQLQRTVTDDASAIDKLAVCKQYENDVRAVLQSGAIAVDLPSINWSQLMPDSTDPIGSGAFGDVYRMKWLPNSPSPIGRMVVAAKVSTRMSTDANGRSYESELERALQEAERVLETHAICSRSAKDRLIQVYGFAEGDLPDAFTNLFGLPVNEEAFAVVMKLEGGGSLDKKLSSTSMVMREKLRLLAQITHGLAELHAVGVIHGDMKPANILLSDSTPPDVVIADFGLAEIRDVGELGGTTLQRTTGGVRGTPVYCAPEMLQAHDDGTVAKASRSTDAYALAVLAHELLSGEKPFADVTSEAALVRKVCVDGARPSLDRLPSDTPPAIIEMIKSCWDVDRHKRRSAVECLAIVEHELAEATKQSFDICILEALPSGPFANVLRFILTTRGYRVWNGRRVEDGIAASKIILACLDRRFETDRGCMDVLRKATSAPLNKTVVSVVAEGGTIRWDDQVSQQDLFDRCKFKTQKFVDFSPVTSLAGLHKVDGPSDDVFKEVAVTAIELFKILEELGCRPESSHFDAAVASTLPLRIKPQVTTTSASDKVLPFIDLEAGLQGTASLLVVDRAAALTPSLDSELNRLAVYPKLLQYEGLTRRAHAALTSNPPNFSLAKKLGAQRSELRLYVSTTVFFAEQALRELSRLKTNIQARYQALLREISKPESIEHSVICLRAMEEVDLLITSRFTEPKASEVTLPFQPKAALQGEYEDYVTLTDQHPLIVQYVTLTEKAHAALLQGKIDDAKSLGAQRCEVRLPMACVGTSIEGSKRRLLQVQGKIRSRFQALMTDLGNENSISFATTCLECVTRIDSILSTQFKQPAPASQENLRAMNDNPEAALTRSHHMELTLLEQNGPMVIEYEKLSKLMQAAVDSGRLDDARRLTTQRAALGFSPSHGLTSAEDLHTRYQALKVGIKARYEELLDTLFEPDHIGYGITCLSHIDKIEAVLKSDVFAAVARARQTHLVITGQSAALEIFSWSQISATSPDCLLGNGSFGRVYELRLDHTTPVAVKTMSKSICRVLKRDYEEERKRARQEAERVLEVSCRGSQVLRDLIVQVYGFVEGPVSDELISMLRLPRGEEAFGIIMPLAAGGSLVEFFHPSELGSAPKHLSTTEKVAMLVQITRGLAELHAVGVIHGDMKPANILLNNDGTALRIADFGLSVLRDHIYATMGQSVTNRTSAGIRGTPVYCAPEMLQAHDDGTVAKASRSTDVYALAVLAHELLSGEKPFADVTSEAALVRRVCVDGARPSLDRLPSDTPPAIIAMIKSCWDVDRHKRRSAVECLAIVEHDFSVMRIDSFDIFFSHRWGDKRNKAFMTEVCRLMRNAGYIVWFDVDHMGLDLVKSMKEGIEKSKVVVACVDSGYQTRDNCMLELRHACSGTRQSKIVVTVVAESNPLSWANDELRRLCELRTKPFVDISASCALDGWEAADGPTEDMKSRLKNDVGKLLQFLERDIGCPPSLRTR